MGREEQVRPVHMPGDLEQIVGLHQAAAGVVLQAVHLQPRRQLLEQLLLQGGVILQPHRRTVTTPLEHLRHGVAEVLGCVLVDEDVRVAGDPYQGQGPDLVPGEKSRHVGRQHRLHGHQGDLIFPMPHRHKAGQYPGQVHESDLLAPPHLPGAGQAQDQVQGAALQGREGVGGAHDHRGDDRVEFLLIVAIQVRLLVEVQLVVLRHPDPLLGQLVQQQLQGTLLARDQLVHQAGDPIQLLPRRAPVGAGGLHLRVQLTVQPPNPDHEEFVQVGGEDGQKLHPLQQRVGGVLCLLQHALVKA